MAHFSIVKITFSKRNPAKNVSTSFIGGVTKGNSDSSDGEDTEFTGEERRSNVALLSDAPKRTQIELTSNLKEE
jgi:hypothetical protein